MPATHRMFRDGGSGRWKAACLLCRYATKPASRAAAVSLIERHVRGAHDAEPKAEV